MSIRVHELAKELNVSSKDLIEKLKSKKIDAKSHMSVLTDDQVAEARKLFSKAPKENVEKKAAPAPVATPKTSKESTAKPAITTTSSAQKPGSTASAASFIESAKKEMQTKREVIKPAVTPAAKPVVAPPVAAVKSQPQNTVTTPAKVHSSPAVHTPITSESSAATIKKAAEPLKQAPTASFSNTRTVDSGTYTQKTTQASASVQVKTFEVSEAIIVKDLAAKLNIGAGEIISKLIKVGVFANINQSVPFETAKKVAVEYGYEVIKPVVQQKDETTNAPASKTESKNSQLRAPVVTFMGHVDHGKTSLLDAIRKTKVAAGEAGGITQHIGAYEVFLPKGAVTFLDTPGHEAFTAMRARGAKATDVVVLVVAADDGVMPQTVEAIDHAKAAGVPIVVAINKTDLPSANPERVKKELMEKGLMPEEWGGKTVMMGVSAKTGKGIDELLEILILESDLLELKADPTVPASGVVIEAELSKDKGVLATVLIQNGTLRIGDVVVVGSTYCKVRAMINDRGHRIKEALPSMPVEILGLPSVPKAGDLFEVVADEHDAQEIVEKKIQEQKNQKSGASLSHVTLEHVFEDVKSGKVNELKLIIKSDVQGSVEALSVVLSKIQSKQVRLSIIHTGIGDITESDVMLAAASNAVIIGFHVGMSSAARDIAEYEQVDVRFYSIIYEAKNAIEKAMEGLLEPERKEVSLGIAEVRQVFKVSKKGTIAGCTVIKGKIIRNCHCRVMRNGKKVHEGKVESLKRFKDDAREVLEGFECGIGVSNFDEIMISDRVEAFEVQEIARKLS